MECHGRTCTQQCDEGATKCSLQCDSKQRCKQICNKGNFCSLVCHGNECEQECKSGASKWNLQCGGKSCEQTCDKGDCTLECHGQYCSQQCNGNQKSCMLKCAIVIGSNQCRQTCSPSNNKCTMKNLTTTKILTSLAVAPRTTLVHQRYPCKHFCAGELSNCSWASYSYLNLNLKIATCINYVRDK